MMCKKIMLLSILGMILISSPLSSHGKHTTIQGVVQETKDGIYVGGILVIQEALPPGQKISELVGKKVEITGHMKTAPAIETPPTPAPQVQHRAGPYQYMEKVDSIKILKD